MTKISTSGIAPQQQIKSEHLLRIINALSGDSSGVTIEVSGSVTASYFVGDGSQLTNLPIPSGSGGSGSGDWNGQYTGSAGILGSLNINGPITASYFVGDGSQLTNLPTQSLGLQEVLDVSGFAKSSDSANIIDISLLDYRDGYFTSKFTDGVFDDLQTSIFQNFSTLELQSDNGKDDVTAKIYTNLGRFGVEYSKVGGGTNIINTIDPISNSTLTFPSPSADGTYYLTHAINNQKTDTTGNIDYTTEEDIGLTLNLSDNIAGKIFNEATPLAYEDDPFVIDNLKTGGYVINYIDTTGSTDFPAVTNSAGDEILTKGDAFREDAIFKMVVSSPNGVDVEYFFVDYLNTSSGGNFIPLSGTEVGSPVTGDIEFSGYTKIQWLQDTEYEARLEQGEEYLSLYAKATSETHGIFLGLNSLLNHIEIQSSEPTSKGLQGLDYFGANYDDNTYVQKKYVDDEIDAIPTPTLSEVLAEGNVADTDIVLSNNIGTTYTFYDTTFTIKGNEDEDASGIFLEKETDLFGVYAGNELINFLRLSNTDFHIGNNTAFIRQYSVDGISVYDSYGKGLKGSSYYGANYDDNTYVQKKYVDDTIESLIPISTADTGTVISLTTSGGNLCNMASANTNTTYTTTGTVLNAYAKVLINAASQPTVTGATLRAGATFVPSTNMYMVVSYNGVIVEYYFLEL